MNSKPSLILYAPGVHAGGGLTLLTALADAWPSDTPCLAFLDRRAAATLACPANWTVVWCARSVWGVLAAEHKLAQVAGPGAALFCFASLPPLWARAREVVVYVQNAYLVGMGPPLRGRLAFRVWAERMVFRLGMRRITRFWVQTRSMERAVKATVEQAIGKCPPIELKPFWSEPPRARRAARPQYDFVYVADGAPHKNHLRLLEAWKQLAAEGRFPSLAITLGPRDAALARRIQSQVEALGLKIANLGHLARDEVMALYGRSGALLFVSTTESFGLPLLEAERMGLPILAAERDFVRDVCTPAVTFDPFSATSIAEAVKRSLGQATAPTPPLSASAMGDAVAGLQGPDARPCGHQSPGVDRITPTL